MAFLKPDKVITVPIGKGDSITINQKIIPDSARATKNICDYIKKGQPVKPCKKLSDGTGRPKGITVHNTNDIKAASGTNPAEQYCRATYPNGNMGGVVVHFYVWHGEIWQQLAEDERGWHATDGSKRGKSKRPGETIGGNLDTIAIECIGPDPESEETTAKLVAHLLYKHGLRPETDVYAHRWFYPSKQCPVYILPHWSDFIEMVKWYYAAILDAGKPAPPAQPNEEERAAKKAEKKGLLLDGMDLKKTVTLAQLFVMLDRAGLLD